MIKIKKKWFGLRFIAVLVVYLWLYLETIDDKPTVHLLEVLPVSKKHNKNNKFINQK